MNDNKIIFIGAGPTSYSAIKALRDSGCTSRILIYTSPLNNKVVNDSFYKGSPKLRQKEFLSASSNLYNFLNIIKSNFSYIPVGGVGGGVNFWGASISEFCIQDIKSNNLNYINYKKNLERVYSFIKKVNINNSSFLTSNRIKVLFKKKDDIEIKSPELAVDDALCTKCGNCFDPCKTKAIWSLDDKDFKSLNVEIKFEIIESLEKKESIYYLYNSKKKLIDRSKYLVLGANVASNFKLLCSFSKIKKARIYSTPSYSFLFFAKEKLRGDIFGMGNATFRIFNDRRLISFGNLYDGRSLNIKNRKIFFSSNFFDFLAKKIANYLIFGAGFFSSKSICTFIILNKNKISFNSKLDNIIYHSHIKFIKKTFSKNVVERFGPIFFKKGASGIDIHYAGGIPNDLKCNSESGEVMGLKGLFVLGGSNFKFLPPTSPTLSFMANAYGIGKFISNDFNSQ
jgi:ferredoxin